VRGSAEVPEAGEEDLAEGVGAHEETILSAPVLAGHDGIDSRVGVPMDLALQDVRDQPHEVLDAFLVTGAVGEEVLHASHVPGHVEGPAQTAQHEVTLLVELPRPLGCALIEFGSVKLGPPVAVEEIPGVLDDALVHLALGDRLQAPPLVAPLVDHVPVPATVRPPARAAVGGRGVPHPSDVRGKAAGHPVRDARWAGEVHAGVDDLSGGHARFVRRTGWEPCPRRLEARQDGSHLAHITAGENGPSAVTGRIEPHDVRLATGGVQFIVDDIARAIDTHGRRRRA